MAFFGRLILILAILCVFAQGVLVYSEEIGGAKADQEYQTATIKTTQPLALLLEPEKRIYSSREGVMVKFILKATQRVKVCYAKDILSQMQLKISRSGHPLALQPLVVQDNSEIFQQPVNSRWLEPGQSLTFRSNLKRFHFAAGERWEPAEYTVSATFGLCDQAEDQPYDPAGKEMPIRTVMPAWFMIMS